MVNSTGLVSSGAGYALENLSLYTRVGSFSVNVTSSDENSSSSTESSNALNSHYLNEIRNNALIQLADARRINSQSQEDITSIESLLSDLSSEVTTFATYIGKGGSANISARTDLLASINDIAQNINHEIERSTYKSEAILGGTYSHSGQLTFDTALFGTDLTTLPHFLSLKSDGDQLALGSEGTDTFSVEVNGAVISEDASEEDISDFQQQITDALTQITEISKRIVGRDLFLNIRTSRVYETEIEPARLESEQLSNNQKILNGFFNPNPDYLRLNGQIISVKA